MNHSLKSQTNLHKKKEGKGGGGRERERTLVYKPLFKVLECINFLCQYVMFYKYFSL